MVKNEKEWLSNRQAVENLSVDMPGSIVNLAIFLSSTIKGSNDCYDADFLKKIVDTLKQRIEIWEESLPIHEKVDSAAKNLILVVLEEYENSLNFVKEN